MNKKALIASLAALALAIPAAGALPAVASPSPAPPSAATATTAPARSDLKVSMTAPSSPTRPVVFEVGGLEPGASVDAVAVLARLVNKGPYAAGTTEEADANGRVTVTLTPFDGRWTTDESYLVFVNGGGSQWQGHFALASDTSTAAAEPAASPKPTKTPSNAPSAKDSTGGLAKTGV